MCLIDLRVCLLLLIRFSALILSLFEDYFCAHRDFLFERRKLREKDKRKQSKRKIVKWSGDLLGGFSIFHDFAISNFFFFLFSKEACFAEEDGDCEDILSYPIYILCAANMKPKKMVKILDQ